MAPALLGRGEPCPQPQPVSCLHNHHQHGSHSSIPVPWLSPGKASPPPHAKALLSGLASPLRIPQEPEHFSTSQPQFAAPQPSSSSVFTESHPVGVPLPSLSLLPPSHTPAHQQEGNHHFESGDVISSLTLSFRFSFFN